LLILRETRTAINNFTVLTNSALLCHERLLKAAIHHPNLCGFWLFVSA
jgi:hypothetical protein